VDGRSYVGGKLFAISVEDAARFGWINYRLSGKPFTLVEVAIPTAAIDRYYHGRMDRMPAIAVNSEQLAEFNNWARISVLSSIPIPRR
jgi:hypothetical protein